MYTKGLKQCQAHYNCCIDIIVVVVVVIIIITITLLPVSLFKGQIQ